MANKKKLVLIDGNALIHRAFHAFSRANLVSPTGEPTGGTFGFAMMLLDIFTKLRPDYIAVAFDTGKPTFRHEEYKEYKAQRVKAPQELYDQIPRIQELVETFNIPVFLKEGFEADDVIGTLARQAPQDIDVYIATGDMDALQLVNNHTFVYAPRKGFADIVTYNTEKVLETKGLLPEQMIDFKGLRGDPSDNIPGVPGIGEVTAKKLLFEFKTMENIYQNLDKIKEKTRILLRDNEKIALQSKKLATILTDIPIELNLKKAEAIEFNPEEVRQLFDKLGFRSLINKIPNGTLKVSTNQRSFFEKAPKGASKFKDRNIAKISKGMGYIQKLDKDLEPVLRKMEKNGILLDVSFLEKMKRDVSARLQKLTQKIYREAGEEFNIASPLQLANILFNKLKLPTTNPEFPMLNIRKTKTGYSTSVSELEKLIGQHNIIGLILEYRQLAKLKNTYLETLPQQVDKNNRIHTTYAQDTSTGRLSSSDPNLQNIPIRTELGAEVRKAFVAPPGKKILKADYSQIELRIVAHLAKDETMIEAFKRGEDIHARTAAEITGKKMNEITKAERRIAKTVNFSILYGVSPWGLAARSNMSVAQARKYIEKYFKIYSNVKKYMKNTIAFAQKHGYVKTLLGRKRYIPEIDSKIPPMRAAAERAAANMPIQGTAADMIKAAMIEIDKKLSKVSPDAKMLLQVHDELVFEVPTKDVPKVSKLVKTVMENVYKLDVPILADTKSGKSWGETK
ncbi:hypothetical protein DRH29_00845 [candidate division Kazan bacterium]|uniref:DNA-directed DNA polymerase n=1 Tax=candidate division Kazan bacterium TaxID=2202143 RepID=A0A420ZD37_UNCK3|nr:MAG: hypothetical protein DRH29_00845 [candidate division Kazan bacterium]